MWHIQLHAQLCKRTTKDQVSHAGIAWESCWQNTLSMNLQSKNVNATGLQSTRSLACAFFGSGIMVLSFQAWGSTLQSKDSWKSCQHSLNTTLNFFLQFLLEKFNTLFYLHLIRLFLKIQTMGDRGCMECWNIKSLWSIICTFKTTWCIYRIPPWDPYAYNWSFSA